MQAEHDAKAAGADAAAAESSAAATVLSERVRELEAANATLQAEHDAKAAVDQLKMELVETKVTCEPQASAVDSWAEVASTPAKPTAVGVDLSVTGDLIPALGTVVSGGGCEEQSSPGSLISVNKEFTTSLPIVYIELGAQLCRVGIYNAASDSIDCCFTCPSMIARPKGSHALSDRGDIIKGASFTASDMYEYFRTEGVFVGRDAEYCAFGHPDGGLRSKLECVYPVAQLVSGDTITTASARRETMSYIVYIIRHCLRNAFDVNDLTGMQVVCAYKLHYGDDSIRALVECLFESPLRCMKATLMAEASLCIAACSLNSALLVNIGPYCTSVTAVYESMTLRNATQILHIGGEDVVTFMESLLDSLQATVESGDISGNYTDGGKNSALVAFSSAIPRRRRQIARECELICQC